MSAGKVRRLRLLASQVNDSTLRYRASVTVSEKEGKKTLDVLIEQSERLRTTLTTLDTATRTALVSRMSVSRNVVDPHSLERNLKMLVIQVQYARRHLASPKRGRHELEPRLKLLIEELAILWCTENPLIKGVNASKGMRRGPMLDFVWIRLRRAKIRMHSKAELGKLLYARRTIIAGMAKRWIDKGNAQLAR